MINKLTSTKLTMVKLTMVKLIRRLTMAKLTMLAKPIFPFFYLIEGMFLKSQGLTTKFCHMFQHWKNSVEHVKI
jgi:hypothetical protein